MADDQGRFRSVAGERWRERTAEELTERQQEQRRLAAAMRRVIGGLVATDAPTEHLVLAADELEGFAEALEARGGGRSMYEGFAETANAGGAASVMFEHSPLVGRANPLAPPMVLDVLDDRVEARATFGAAYEGPPGCVHGGYVAAAFDELLGAAQSLGGLPGMTGTLSVRYLRPTPLHAELNFVGRLDRVDGRKNITAGWVEADGERTAEAEGIFVTIGPNRFRELKEQRDAELAARAERDGPPHLGGDAA